ncbi:acetyl-CoA carboxylase biotin carboxyl carrier protein [Acidicapsa acidisoli]|uniref:acetyl-CoA carboxylase biotin carboxyl carrier protein n=1 Tax=Acidicapsa acidisoli TaxID=1615681 RepID=UPI0021E05789|nr:acetyl-CoA carboxylase biotin carboxyl carrier protein [Acidicapsa acidisoli]
MKPDGLEELKELIAFLKENEIAEFDLDRGDFKVRLKFASAVVPPAAPASGLDLVSLARLMGLSQPGAAAPAMAVAPLAVDPASAPSAGAAPSAPAVEAESLHIIKSPIVGTFYESPSPGSSAFVSNGDRIEKGQVVCIVEAMKLMNEIEADASGEIVKRLVTNGQPVEYGQPLFAIRVS